MRIRLSITLDFERRQPPGPERFEHRDNDGTLADLAAPHPIGFVPYRESRPEPDERGTR